MIKEKDIVEGLVPTEAVVINSVKQLGSKFSIAYSGYTTKSTDTVIKSRKEIEQLKVISAKDTFNFTGDAIEFKLFAEAERINTAYQFDPLFAINCSVVDALPHQVEAVYKYLLPQPRIRFLLADDTGAGKTIMTGLLLKELLMRNAINRILIVTPGGLTRQWRDDELYARFNLDFKLVNRSVFATEPTVFQNTDRIVTSIDFISHDDVLQVLENTTWDMVVFDEAHKLSAYQYGQRTHLSQRYKAAATLSQLCEHILLLTATPHRGLPGTFKMLMQLLDKDIFATSDLASDRVREVSHNGINKFFIRRLKEDMKDWNGCALYMPRYTKTVSYKLTPDEKCLYDAVTRYLTVRKDEAQLTRNQHVTLALQVMQRRLVSSIYAIKKTLYNRWRALNDLNRALEQNPALWSQKVRIDDFDDISIDDFDDLDDNERDELENIMQDPRKFKLFTTAKKASDIKAEADELYKLYQMAEALYTQHSEEQKYIKLRELLREQEVVDGEKLVIFTEHKDTLDYLADRLKNNGYKVAVIHGALTVDERREAQDTFRTDAAQILICTDAAGEGINLQFCRLLINWDIPWNPNRLEQRMGRIHRYGQKKDVLVFNLVADNTREGQVLSRLLRKLEIIRSQLGDDRVYDVIQDVLKDVPLDAIIRSVFNGQQSQLDNFISTDDKQLGDIFKQSIDTKENQIAHSTVDYHDAHRLKDMSDRRRLQPIYIRNFFETAFKYLGGTTEAIDTDVFRITLVPDCIAQHMAEVYNLSANVQSLKFFFDKRRYNDYRLNNSNYGAAHYINPGNPFFDTVVAVVRERFRANMARGTILVSPDDHYPFLAFFVRNRIKNSKIINGKAGIANELLTLVCQNPHGTFRSTSPAKLLDLVPPQNVDLNIDTPPACNTDEVVMWAFENITEPLCRQTQDNIEHDTQERKKYILEAYNEVNINLQEKLNEQQSKFFFSNEQDTRADEKINALQKQIEELKKRKDYRLEELDKEKTVTSTEPEILGCAYVVPLHKADNSGQHCMHPDEQVELAAMQVAMDYELNNGRQPADVSADNLGYDIDSLAADGSHRYIEVKGRAQQGGVMLSNNEYQRLNQLGDKAWLYVVRNAKSNQPQLITLQDPVHNQHFNQVVKTVQYYLPPEQLPDAPDL